VQPSATGEIVHKAGVGWTHVAVATLLFSWQAVPYQTNDIGMIKRTENLNFSHHAVDEGVEIFLVSCVSAATVDYLTNCINIEILHGDVAGMFN
jgi:hypothetical protein